MPINKFQNKLKNNYLKSAKEINKQKKHQAVRLLTGSGLVAASKNSLRVASRRLSSSLSCTTKPRKCHKGHCIITWRQKWSFLTHPPTLWRFVTFPNTHPTTPPPASRNYSSTAKRPLKTTQCCLSSIDSTGLDKPSCTTSSQFSTKFKNFA